ncbi:hypothetical protein G6F56_005996 [Rhizopus delemar]|nr:hypothetical protein G6F56_005996 [Rhizopus delemar]
MHPSVIYKSENLIRLATLPGPDAPKDWNLYLRPIVSELSDLETNGLIVRKSDGRLIHAKVYLLGATGDLPAVALFAQHDGHQSTYGCRICKTETISFNNGRCFCDYKAP